VSTFDLRSGCVVQHLGEGFRAYDPDIFVCTEHKQIVITSDKIIRACFDGCCQDEVIVGIADDLDEWKVTNGG
jgi:hypothetical protein